MSLKNLTVTQIFDELDAYRDFCRYEGKYYDEAALFNRGDRNWRAYEKYCEWRRLSGRDGGRRTNIHKRRNK